MENILSALSLSENIRSGKLSVREALDAVFEKIEQKEERLHCFLTIDREGAYREAEALQEKVMRGEAAGPLFGVPVAVKDNLCTKGLRTTCGSKMLEEFVPPYDATAVKSLRDAGMIILGKTNLDEFAMGNTTETSYFGFTRNPQGEAYVPGGSSGGSAAAVASGECLLALGTDTGGSVRQPASHCGVVGVKPTYGSVSRYGLIAYCSSMDQVGPIARNVSDCAALMEVLCSWDEKDSTSKRRGRLELMPSLEQGVAGRRIGIPKEYFDASLDPQVAEAVMGAARALERRGAIVKEFSLPLFRYFVPDYYLIACAEASSNLERYDGMKYGFSKREGDLHETYRKTRAQGFGDEMRRRILLGTFALSEGYYDAYYLKALKVRRLIANAFDEALLEFDLILGPVVPSTAPRLGEAAKDPVQSYMADAYTVPANLTGLPAISVPCRRDDKGLPIGVQLMGRAFDEAQLFAAARVIEKELQDA
ncbi:MAG: Asp-tRNA(Asn)/Glu-tRNA(Gln) amidotransferase subunit GatA [Lachnospiraceae bacterium]|nr:Asp-tRNA(Asn)/Glu-tRNA(Gln) amidotransferase subunit GatA [Lachnospiraceae bacterium]